jgi:predicted Zn-dependent peptidase
LTLPAAQCYYLDNGIPVYDLRMGAQEAVKLEIAFFSGRPYERKKLVSRATGALLKEGTLRRSGVEMTEQIDFYGSTVSIPFNLDTSNIVLYSLVRHFEPLLALISEMITEPVFPEKELKSFIQRNQQRLKVDLSKNDVIAYRKITECIFGEHHPYGYNSYPETYATLEREDLLEHYQRLFCAENCIIFVSGKTSDELIRLLNKYLGKTLQTGKRATYEAPVVDFPVDSLHIPHPDTVQTAIRIGCRTFTKQHADFNGLYILTTILGGYFGSRLMANIREDKGYTYNIYATLDSMLYDGYFYIGTEVGNEFVEPTLREIYHEMQLLGEELVSEEEIEMLRNYLMGNFLAMLDGPFNISEVLRTMVLESTPLESFVEMIETVNTIQPEQLRELARKYLRRDNMWEVVVGSAV